MGNASVLSLYLFSHFTKCHHVQSLSTLQRWTLLSKCLVNTISSSTSPFQPLSLQPPTLSWIACSQQPFSQGPVVSPKHVQQDVVGGGGGHTLTRPLLAWGRPLFASGDGGGGRTVALRHFQISYITLFSNTNFELKVWKNLKAGNVTMQPCSAICTAPHEVVHFCKNNSTQITNCDSTSNNISYTDTVCLVVEHF